MIQLGWSVLLHYRALFSKKRWLITTIGKIVTFHKKRMPGVIFSMRLKFISLGCVSRAV